MNHNLCPGCMKHCYLDEARCKRGIEYAKTRILPPRKPRPEGASTARKLPEQKMKYLAMNQDEKIAHNLTELGSVFSDSASTEELLSCLRKEEQNDLLMLTEKLRHAWIHKAREHSAE